MRMFGRRSGRGLVATLLLAGVMALAGCGSSDAPAASNEKGSTAPAAAAESDGKPRPVQVRVPKIGAESSLIRVSMNEDGTMQVPSAKKPMQAAWYRFSPVPGEKGPAIVLGHVDGEGQPGIFFKLHELKAGDEVFVKRSDDKDLKFVVKRVEQVPKDKFPEDAVYGDTDKAELRLITCGGAFDKAAHSYKDNVIVYADLAA
ncbi:class F sortase [Longimycelium tulufanense]|uniref:Class F sortase n=2 Tax=Longimycelium tulufanense TaxID=907463 RepID=A0A8J3FUT3_9PSEU|nr:class F sortase [Longimycelium tulufanense]GGM57723.1 class F sortase [Longimycelium tulufanense]